MVERKVHSVSLMILMKMRYNIGCRAGKGTSRFVEGRMRDCSSSHPIFQKVITSMNSAYARCKVELLVD
jgi:hypothetical protein